MVQLLQSPYVLQLKWKGQIPRQRLFGDRSQDKGCLELRSSPVQNEKLNCGNHSPLHLGTSPASASENLQVHDMSEKSSSLGECKDAEEETEGLSCGNKDTDMDGLLSTSIEPNECGQESVDLLGHTAVQEGSLKSGQGSKSSEESSKVGYVSLSPPAPSYRRLVVGLLENLHQLRPLSYFLSYLNASSSYPL